MYQFNNKEYEKYLNNFSMHRPLLLTLGFNDYVKYERGEKVRERMMQNHKHFLNHLHRLTYKNSKKKIIRYVVIEKGGKTKGMHSHLVIETPEHLSTTQYKKLCEVSWERTKDGTHIHVVEGYNKNGLDSYCSKQQDIRNKDAEVDIGNSYY